MSKPLEPLQALQAKVEARADTRVPSDRWAAHEAVGRPALRLKGRWSAAR